MLKKRRYLLIALTLLLLGGGVVAYKLYHKLFLPNVKTAASFLIGKETSYDMLLDSLEKYEVLIDNRSFDWLAKRKNYPKHIKPGMYAFQLGQSSNALVNMLLAGNQVSVELTFNNLRFMSDFAAKVAGYLQPDSLEMLSYLKQPEVWEKYGFDAHTFHAMFIPNTYRMYWTSTPEQFVARMNAEYKHFWTDARLNKAKALNLSPIEVITLASIVQEETIKADEKPIVAGLYLNRLRRGMLLQADPTVKYAVGNFGLNRVLNKHLEMDSPYNTYKYVGLPPGPINFPEISSIDAVLHATKHDYLFMCAKEDFSGYHNFAKTLRQHNNNARRYRQTLNQRRIYR